MTNLMDNLLEGFERIQTPLLQINKKGDGIWVSFNEYGVNLSRQCAWLVKAQKGERYALSGRGNVLAIWKSQDGELILRHAENNKEKNYSYMYVFNSKGLARLLKHMSGMDRGRLECTVKDEVIFIDFDKIGVNAK